MPPAPAPRPTSIFAAAVTAAALVAGAGNSFVTRLLFQIRCIHDADGASSGFNKPIFATAVAFAAMALSIPLWLAGRHRCASPRCPFRRRHCALFIPSLLDVMATALQCAAVLFISASVNAALRGVMLLFVAALNRCCGVRDGRAGWSEWSAMALAAAAVGVVGAAAVVSDTLYGASSSASSGAVVLPPGASAAIGIGLSLLSNLIMAAQVVYETARLESGAFTPNEVNGVEGAMGLAVCGIALAVFQALPVPPAAALDHGRIESTADTFACLASTPLLAGMTVLLGALFAVSTQAHMVLSAVRGSNFRSVVLVSRCVLVWLMELAAYYRVSDPPSEIWSPVAPLQLAGFAVLVGAGVWQWRTQSAREAGEVALLRATKGDDATAPLVRAASGERLLAQQIGSVND